MEELVLRCNNHSQTRGHCRAELRDVAIVTTCSHVICRACAQESGFLTSPLAERHCPACKAALSKSDDAVPTVLNPSDEYRTTVLSGLDPSIIMECASRALCFWNYQNLQETAYQKHLLSALTQKYSNLNIAMDKLVLEANSELDGMQARISALNTSNVELQQRNTEYATKDRERTKKFNDLRLMYEKLKQRYQAMVQNGSATASAQRAIQSLTDNIVPQRSGIDNSVPQSAGGYFSARKNHITANPIFNSEIQHNRAANAGPYHVDTRPMPPPMTIPTRQGISPAPFGASPSRRISLPSPLRPFARGSNDYHQQKGRHNQAQEAGWSPQNSQHLPTINQSGSRQGTAMGYGGLTAGMKIGNANTGNSLLNQLNNL